MGDTCKGFLGGINESLLDHNKSYAATESCSCVTHAARQWSEIANAVEGMDTDQLCFR